MTHDLHTAIRLDGILARAIQLFGAHPSAIGQHLADALRHMPTDGTQTAHGRPPPNDLPSLTGANAVMSSALVHPIWRRPGFGKLPTTALPDIHATELVGPAGLIAHDTVRVGILWQRPHQLYRDHAHAAEELYIILHGAAGWSVDHQTPVTQRAPAGIHHASWQVHAMQTGNDPMLALWGWTGNIDAATYRLVARGRE